MFTTSHETEIDEDDAEYHAMQFFSSALLM